MKHVAGGSEDCTSSPILTASVGGSGGNSSASPVFLDLGGRRQPWRRRETIHRPPANGNNQAEQWEFWPVSAALKDQLVQPHMTRLGTSS